MKKDAYAQRYADVVAVYGTEEASLFQHYTDYGRAENREAVKAPGKATFDADYYASANPDVVAVYGTGSNNLYQHYLNNLEANTPEYVREFFDSNGDHKIDGVEMGFLQAWMFDNYNPVDKSALDKEEVIAIVRAIQDGTFKLPSSLYYVTF